MSSHDTDAIMQTDGDTGWFTHDRFCMFIHWGLNALPARHEWVKHNEKIPDDVYDKYFRHFDPDLYEWTSEEMPLWSAIAANTYSHYPAHLERIRARLG